jgi:Protein of unknown function (DUF3617)
MKQSLTILPALALLSACGKADGELNPGFWKSTLTVTRFDIPGAPPEVAQRVKAFVGTSQTTAVCLRAAEAKAGVRDFSSSLQQGDCKMEDFKQSAGKMSGTIVCTGARGFGAPKMKMEGSYTTKKVEMSLSGEVSDSKIPDGNANIGLTIVSELTGDCKG